MRLPFRHTGDTNGRRNFLKRTAPNQAADGWVNAFCLLSREPSDSSCQFIWVSKTLANLVENGFLVSRGATRGKVYFFPNQSLDIVGDGLSSKNKIDLEEVGTKGSRLEHLKGGGLEHLRPLAEQAWKSKKVSKKRMQEMLVQLCNRTSLTAQQLAELLNRDIHSLKYHYLKPMVKSGHLKLLYPDKPNHPNQAYTTDEAQKSN